MTSATGSDVRFIGERRYHTNEANRYPLPNDTEEVNRLDELHFMYRCHLGTNILAPLHDPKSIVDIGTGSGRWPIEVANEYKTASVTGFDLSATSPTSEIPPGCKFIVGDLNNGLHEFADGSLDLVHSRVIMAGVKRHQWPLYLKNVLRILKPGAWAQFTEFRGTHFLSDGNVPEPKALREFEGYLDEMIRDMDIYWNGDHLEQNVRDAGFEDIQVKKILIDIGDWRDDSPAPEVVLGRRAAERVHAGAYEALANRMRNAYPDDYERKKFVERIRADLGNPEYRLYFDSYDLSNASDF